MTGGVSPSWLRTSGPTRSYSPSPRCSTMTMSWMLVLMRLVVEYFYLFVYLLLVQQMAESCLNFPGLPEEARKKKVPLEFHGFIGQDLKEETSPSFFNRRW